MTPDFIFKLSGIVAAVGWIIILILSPFWNGFEKFVMGIVVTLLALTYSFLNFSNFHLADLQKFSSLDGIQELYQNKDLLTAGWVHFLAFDLLTAVWIKRNSVKYGISHWLIVVPVIFTCMLGPLGFLLYIVVRSLKTKMYFAENF